MDESINNLLKDLGQALIDAIAESPDVSANLLRLQQSGYSLYLTVDCKQDSACKQTEGEDDGATAEEDGSARRLRLQATPSPGGEPSFRINTRDLSFLRSIGIDPTRKRRGRRS